ncbi:hypothetical protein CJF31_00011269 [Rutstroemia sp. NJR-2017a BVV2]|nr:hypothetical protein CJF31_00011269 [Rutstroemia sp. NJR-2017a BVV2]
MVKLYFLLPKSSESIEL